ncbi:GNAT family N-acetyltransferase [Cellulomonas wangsupingiae]|uniref:GNAT family N-acetyltransferase n=1 Tax=Cellulomonas wangsupingiae TaxID=2968085 RepID=A0ABY5K8X7_9CELL|nr:GNAT family N-acetyltransferase [Cellulomonas wangsupingiae]MCC2333188.1 GNAT family N-acetyltransferase [Cellulomonas wangsupingiae]UUI66901.1 GNAT family N-acetyltransferase [Cellulomonas wangsupingiae]
MSGGLLARLPAALRGRRDVLDLQDVWADAAVLAGSTDAVVLVREDPAGSVMWGAGDPQDLGRLVPGALVDHGPGLRWVTVPRAVPLPQDALSAAGVVPCTSWDRLSCDVAPVPQPGEDAVEELDVAADLEAITACLDAANPTTHARPGAPDDVVWWGVRDGRAGLLGVVGVARRPGDGAPSMHLHGLGVVPAARGRGLGTALAARATRRALEDGAPWVALGMYTDNDAARRVYGGLGFHVDVENAGYGPPGAARP